MKEEQARYYLKKLLRRIQFIKLTEILLMSLGIGFIMAAISGWVFDSLPSQFIAGGVSAVFAALLKTYRSGILLQNELHVAFFLNEKFPVLQDSADLVLSNEGSLLQQLQKQKVLSVLSDISKQVRLPNRVGLTIVVLLTGLVTFRFLPERTFEKDQPASGNEPTGSGLAVAEEKPATLAGILIRVVPPAYTGIERKESTNGNLKVLESSVVEWNVRFSADVREQRLIFSANDSVGLSKMSNGSFRALRTIQDHTLYQIAWKDTKGGLHRSDFYQLEVIKDQPPKVEVRDLPQFTELNMNHQSRVPLKVQMIDDYGLNDAFITATVSKGSGEAVKFREERLNFTKPTKISGKKLEASRSIDLRSLGLEPGDELYFYVEVHDSKVPEYNRARTETFFISLQDTASTVMLTDAGLGVDLMPDYFRSQRQIIIDSEKLLAEEKKIKRTEFNSRSNELGFDQKTLRLKYGQFLGDEEETGVPEEVIEEAEDAKDEETGGDERDPLKKVTHEHDTKNEHNLVPEKKANEHAHADPNEKEEDPLKAFRHEHDSQDETAFFVQSVKTKLKLALTLMWDAELHLRMFDPKKSLPYQYKILNLLKEISQDSRIYVHRTGFDPPPIKEEKRLSGDLGEIVNSTGRMKADDEKLGAIRLALTETEKLLHQPDRMDANAMQTFEAAGYELAAQALKEPGKYLESLSLMKRLSENSIPQEELRQALMKVRKDLWTVLPAGNGSPGQKSQSLHKLDRQFVKNLDRARRE